ncbi:MAG: alpha/beta hydrolase [Deltaproteobacteria bacterium]|nr:alpha/beta hydrolase [Deltaproteobacteria bacterium]
MPLIDAGGLELHVQTLGPGPEAPRPPPPPVIFLHGLLVGSMATWYFSLAPALAAQRKVVLYDLRGHGRSATPARGYALHDHLVDLGAVLGACEVKSGPVVLVGHSFGALVALMATLRRPERVAKLVLCELPLPPASAGVIPDPAQIDVEGLFASLPPAVQAAVAEGGRRGRRFVERVRTLVEETSLLADLFAMTDVDDTDLGGLMTPTLALYGRDSLCLPTGERLARVMPAARLVTLPGGHFLPVESPDAVGEAVKEFLGG